MSEVDRREAVRITTLPNGLRVVTEHMPSLATTALGVWSGAGSRHEQAEEQGLAHLLEHMAFKGTSRRSALQIAEEVTRHATRNRQPPRLARRSPIPAILASEQLPSVRSDGEVG